MNITRVCFVIPTYNEARNIAPLLQRLGELYSHADTRFLVVDDSSPDGTGAEVERVAATDSRVHLLSGQRRGLGDAYVRGMAAALQRFDPQAVVQMDADFSHDPADAARLLEALDCADVVIGSRYVPRGSLDEKWSLWRRLLSRWGNRLARFIAGIPDVKDCTAGFKAIRAEALQVADIGRVRGQGYVFQVELLHRLSATGARIMELPIHFREREHGVTKLGFGNLLEFFFVVWRLRLGRYRTFAKFALIGLSGVVVNLGVFQLLLNLGMHHYIASPIAIETSVVSNFLLNNYWTFADRIMEGRKRVRGLKFNLVSLLALAVSFSTFVVLSLLFPQAPLVALQACSIVPATIVNYSLNSWWTFANSSEDDS